MKSKLLTKIVPVVIAGEFSPMDISGLGLWLKADEGTYQDDGMGTPATADDDVVGGWEDQSGNGFDVTQAVAANKPLLKTGILNGKPVLRFDKTNDYLSRAAVLGESDTQGTLFFVAGTDDADQQMVLCISDDASNSRRILFGKAAIDDRMELFQRAADVGEQIDGSTAVNDGVHRIFTFKSSGTVYTFYLNGTAEEINVVAGANNGDWIGDCSSLDVTAVGAWVYSGVVSYWEDDIAEIIYYDTALSDAEREKVENYLGAKYGIT